MLNFSSLARLEVPEKFVWWVGGGVCTVIFMSNPTVVLRLGLGWGFDNMNIKLIPYKIQLKANSQLSKRCCYFKHYVRGDGGKTNNK